jgi:hypothetical protein
MIVTIAYLRNRFELFNTQYFADRLPVPILKVSNARTMLGCLRYKKERRILGRTRFSGFTLSISAFYDLPQEEIDDTILHEMIHLYILSRNIKDDSPHGRMFRQIMHELNSRFGRHITVSHRGRLRQAEKKQTQNIIAVTQFCDGSVGVTRPSMSRIFEINRTLPLYYKVKSIDWYNSRHPYFNSFPRSLKPKIYKADTETLQTALADAIPLKFDNNKITRQ